MLRLFQPSARPAADGTFVLAGSRAVIGSVSYRLPAPALSSPASKDLKAATGCDLQRLLAMVERQLEVAAADICSSSKDPRLVRAKEALIICARRMGTSLADISDLLSVNQSTITRRHDAARRRIADDKLMGTDVEYILEQYRSETNGRIA